MKRHCVGQTFIVYWRKETTLQQTSNLFKLFITSVKAKKQADEFLLFLNFIFHQLFNYVQLNYKLISTLHSALPLVLPCVSSRTHPKKVVQGQEKKACAILRGRAQKEVFPFTQEQKKWKQSPKKWKIMLFEVLISEIKKLVICVFAVKLMWHNVRQCA